jgi:dCMP deaminase
MAVLTASRATCERGRVGCVLVRDKRVLATGYNGPVGGNRDCIGQTNCRRTQDGGCAETAHAEQNAVAYAAQFGVNLRGCTCYMSGYSPCLMCAKLLIQCGCRQVIFRRLYRDTMPLDFLTEVGVDVRLYVGPTPVIGWEPAEPPALPEFGREVSRGQLPVINAPVSEWAVEPEPGATWRLVRVGEKQGE